MIHVSPVVHQEKSHLCVSIHDSWVQERQAIVIKDIDTSTMMEQLRGHVCRI